MPDPKQWITLDNGCKVPIGTPVECKDCEGYLLYNEYIVYDVARIKFKYLIRLNFAYND